MADTTPFDELADVIQLLDSMGLEVVADTHIHEQQVGTDRRIVADLTIVLDDRDDDPETSAERAVRRVARDEIRNVIDRRHASVGGLR